MNLLRSAWLLAAVLVGAPAVASEPLQIRLNGADALTRKVFPVLINGSGVLNQSIAETVLTDTAGGIPFEVPLLGKQSVPIRVKVWITQLALTVPVEPDDWSATILPAESGEARMDSIFAFNRARLGFRLHIRTTPTAPLLSKVPADIRRMAALDERFDVTVAGVTADLDLQLQHAGNGIKVKNVRNFGLQVTQVTVTDSAWLTEIADAVLGFERLFNVMGAGNANTAVTRLANKLLRENLEMEEDLRKAANHALTSLAQQQFPSTVEFPIGNTAILSLRPQFDNLASSNGRLTTGWTVIANAAPSDAVPGLPRPQRSTILPEITTATGDVQALIPYGLVDDVLYELIQAGLLQRIAVPPATAGGVLNGFTTDIVPLAAPRVERDPSNPQQLRVEMPIRLRASPSVQSSGTPTIGDMPTRADATDASRLQQAASAAFQPSIDATAVVGLSLRLPVSDQAGVQLEIVSVAMRNLTGTVAVRGQVSDLGPYRSQLQNAVNNAVQGRARRIALMTRMIGIVPPLRAVVGQPTFGSVYISLPLTISGP